MKNLFFVLAAITMMSSNTMAARENGAPTPVEIKGFAFVPATVTIAAGDAVTWTNKDSAPHTTTSDATGWDSGRLGNGQSFSLKFNVPGTYAYHCGVHPRMKATVIVK